MKSLYRLMIMLSLAMTVSCAKDNFGGFTGNYTFKFSGDINFVSVPDPKDTTGKTYTRATSIQAESGQMDIIDNGDGSLLITMNILAGGAQVMKATYKDGRIELNPFSRVLSIVDLEATGQSGQQAFPSNMKADITGGAYKVSDMVVFDLNCGGSVTYLGRVYEVKENSLKMIAKVNP